MMCILHFGSLYSFGEYGEILKTFPFRADKFALHPNQKYVYISSCPEAMIRVIDLDDLTLFDTIETDFNPMGMAFSETGDRLFVASNVNCIGVYDTQSKVFLECIPVPMATSDLAMGKDGILYATPEQKYTSMIFGIMRIDTINMEYIDSFWDGIPIYASGDLEIDLVRDKLYYGDYGYPTLLTKFDLSTSIPTLEWQNTSQSLGGNGQDLALSNNGQYIVYFVGSGNDGYVVFLFDSSTFEVLGIFDTGHYPREGCFSPDDRILYVAHNNRHIDVWDVQTFEKLPDIMLQGEYYDDVHELFIDPTGQYLFAGIERTHIKVFDTARVVIPEDIKVALDIKPGGCPNPLNVKSKGVLSIAILGGDNYDITEIDPTSVRLAGVEPIRSSYEDVAAPVADANDCNCTTEGPDGFLDLTLKFRTQQVVEAIGDVNNGDVLELPLTGVMSDETPIEGADCIVIRGGHKSINQADINKDGVVNAVDFAILAQNWLQSSIVEE